MATQTADDVILPLPSYHFKWAKWQKTVYNSGIVTGLTVAQYKVINCFYQSEGGKASSLFPFHMEELSSMYKESTLTQRRPDAVTLHGAERSRLE